MKNLVSEQGHARPEGVHWGLMKTFDLLTRTFDWPNAQGDSLKFCSLRKSCQSIKIDHRLPQGTMMALPVPDRPWSTIGVDFIVKLPISEEFESVMVVFNHFSKATHFVPAKETQNAKDLAGAFITNISQLHGLPGNIVSDRGTTFMSQFWSSVLDQLHINPSPSMALHPQTDGKVKRINTILTDYLCHYVSIDEDDSVKWLKLA